MDPVPMSIVLNNFEDFEYYKRINNNMKINTQILKALKESLKSYNEIELEDIYGNKFEIEYESDYLVSVGVYHGKIKNCPKEFKSELVPVNHDIKNGIVKKKTNNIFVWRENGVTDPYWDIELDASKIDFDSDEIRIYSKNGKVWTKNKLNDKSEKLVKAIVRYPRRLSEATTPAKQFEKWLNEKKKRAFNPNIEFHLIVSTSDNINENNILFEGYVSRVHLNKKLQFNFAEESAGGPAHYLVKCNNLKGFEKFNDDYIMLVVDKHDFSEGIKTFWKD